MYCSCGDHPDGAFWTKSGHFGPYGEYSKASTQFDLPKKSPPGATRGAEKVQKWVSDAYPGNIGQLDHYVVFETQSGAVKDILMVKNCSVGAKQTPV